MHIIILMCYEQCRTLRIYNYAGLFQAATCFDIHVASILTPRYIFKEQFVGGDAPMASIIKALQKPCQAKGLCKTSPRRGKLVSCRLQHEHRLRGVNDKACHVKLRFTLGIQCHYNTLRVNVSYIAVVTTYNGHALE